MWCNKVSKRAPRARYAASFGLADAPIVVSLSFSAIVSKLWPSKGDPWPKVPGWTLGPWDGLLPAELVDGGPAMTRAIEHPSAHESTAPI